MKALSVLILVAMVSGCAATHEVKFDVWRGLPADVTDSLKQGILPFNKDQVFKASCNVLEYAPFLQWQYQQVDPKTGLIDAVAPEMREVKMTILDAGAGTTAAKTKFSLLVPQKPLKGQKDIWVNDEDTLRVTAYDLDLSEHHEWHSLTSIFTLDQDYWVSAIYRNLTDKSEVPFALVDLTTGKELSASPPSASTFKPMIQSIKKDDGSK